MKQTKSRMNRALPPWRRISLLALVLAAMSTVAATAQSGGIFEIRRSTIDGGGLTPKSQAGFVVRGTIGQPDPGTLTGTLAMSYSASS